MRSDAASDSEVHVRYVIMRWLLEPFDVSSVWKEQ